MSLKELAKSAIGLLTRTARPWARRWARAEYFAPFDPATLEARTVALVACHWIGDTLYASQVMPRLSDRFPQAEFTILTKPVAADLWRGLVDPSQIIPAPPVTSDRRREKASWRAIAGLARELRPRNFDLVVDLTDNRYSAYFTFLLRPARSLGSDGGELGWLYSRRSPERSGLHISQRPFEVIRPLFGRDRSFAFPAHLRPPQPSCDAQEVLSPMGLSGRPYQLMAPFAGWSGKEWPLENFAAVGRLLAEKDFAVIICGSDAQAARCAELAGQIPGAVAFTGQPLGRMLALASRADGVLANESALSHLGAAYDRRTAAVYIRGSDLTFGRPLAPSDKVKVFWNDATVQEIAAHLAP